MKTTIELDDQLLKKLKKRAAQNSETLASVINTLIRNALQFENARETQEETFRMLVFGGPPKSIVGSSKRFKEFETQEGLSSSSKGFRMQMVDVNVLIYAHRSEYVQHDVAKEFVEKMVNSKTPFALSSLVAAGFVRIVTNRKIHSPATSLDAALATIDSFLVRRNCAWVTPGNEHWKTTVQLATACYGSGSDFSDALHAALAIESGATWVSFDDDFATFEKVGLKFHALKVEPN